MKRLSPIHYQNVYDSLSAHPGGMNELKKKIFFWPKACLWTGHTFTVYSSGEGIEKIFSI